MTPTYVNGEEKKSPSPTWPGPPRRTTPGHSLSSPPPLSALITAENSRGEKKKEQMERTCIFVICDCLPFSRQIDFYVSRHWKLSGLDCQACLALASAAKPVSALYGPALGRTSKPFNSQVIPMTQYRLCLKHLCCFLSLLACPPPPSLRPHSFLFSFLCFSLFMPYSQILKPAESASLKDGSLLLVHTCLQVCYIMMGWK